MEQEMRALGRVFDALPIVQGREPASSVVHRLRVVHEHLRALQLDLRGDVQCGRVADVVGLRLEGAAENADGAAEERAADELSGQVDHSLPASHVDGIDLLEEGQRLVGAELSCAP